MEKNEQRLNNKKNVKRTVHDIESLRDHEKRIEILMFFFFSSYIFDNLSSAHFFPFFVAGSKKLIKYFCFDHLISEIQKKEIGFFFSIFLPVQDRQLPSIIYIIHLFFIKKKLYWNTIILPCRNSIMNISVKFFVWIRNLRNFIFGLKWNTEKTNRKKHITKNAVCV
jgi:hypothetical protein